MVEDNDFAAILFTMKQTPSLFDFIDIAEGEIQNFTLALNTKPLVPEVNLTITGVIFQFLCKIL